jgi:hypothetical protein
MQTGCWNDENRTGLNIESRLAHTSDLMILHTANSFLTSPCLRHPSQPCLLPTHHAARTKIQTAPPLRSPTLPLPPLHPPLPNHTPNTPQQHRAPPLRAPQSQLRAMHLHIPPPVYFARQTRRARPVPLQAESAGLSRPRARPYTQQHRCVFLPIDAVTRHLTNWYRSYIFYPSRLTQLDRLYSNAPQH